MKFSTLLTVIILFMGGIIVFNPSLRSALIKRFSLSSCDTPIAYKLGTIDPKFGLDNKKVTADIGDAIVIWSNDYGKPLFFATSSAKLTINFVYDQRSALNAQINQLQNQLDKKSTTLVQQIDAYKADVAAFEQKLANFNNRVNQINQSGGATPDVYASLIAEQKTLKVEGDALNARAQEYNLSAHNYDNQVRSLNQDVSQFNQAITQKPEEGLYNGKDNTISIYFVNNHQELVHTLAHEFGHALGMQHTPDPQSIMNAYTNNFVTITPQDQEQLDYVCRQQLFINLWIKNLIAQKVLNT